MTGTRDDLYEKIKGILIGLFGEQGGKEKFAYLKHSAETFLAGKTVSEGRGAYEDLAGTVFVIAYPDNVHDDLEYPLKTLDTALTRYFPSIGGIHILPERTMSHGDIWPQDFFACASPVESGKILSALKGSGIIDDDRYITSLFPAEIKNFLEGPLRKIAGPRYETVKAHVGKVLERAWNSHFNDGGFSQKTRAEVDPRFGLNADLERITGRYRTMLDFVVNHLDVDNDSLEEFRRGNNDCDAFIIIYRDRYRQLVADKTLDKTFRPRPFPLFTGMRKYPVTDLEGERQNPDSCAAEMNRIFTANGLDAIDHRIICLLSIYFKIENDQGLTSEDKRIFADFETYAVENGIDTSSIWIESSIQAKQKKIDFSEIPHMEAFVARLGLDVRYADLFMNDADHIFGREFYIYTTFSESQADVNPVSMDGFRMIIDDLFHLLSSGSLSMMRMDAIKYLWKEIGKKNFDMEEGNELIRVIRMLMELVSPETIPLDEVNSPDPVVYSMMKDGGFAYLFGQVNSVPVALNEGALEPLIRFHKMKKEQSPQKFLPFVMLSTHDGRSVQGLGVQRSDGHVSIGQFYNLMDTVEARGGKPKFRSVPAGRIEGDTLRKVLSEAGFSGRVEELNDLFEKDPIIREDLYILRDPDIDESDLLEEIASRLGADVRSLAGSPAFDFFIQWIIYGKTVYELCCTSRSSFSRDDRDGNSLTIEEEAQRLALAQLFVLTQGQDVPAIYFNDLVGLENDFNSFSRSGRPRDLNRRKLRYDELTELMEKDPFTIRYTGILNRILELRAVDRSFVPGRGDFQFLPCGDSVFLHHLWSVEEHSVILGNITNSPVSVTVKRSELTGMERPILEDQVSNRSFKTKEDNFTFDLDPYGFLWLK